MPTYHTGTFTVTFDQLGTYLAIHVESSVTRLGYVWILLAMNFITKVAQMFCDFFGQL